MPEKMKTPTNVSSGKRAQLDFIKELGETGDEIERNRKRRAMQSRQQIKYDGHLESGEELEERIVRESIGELLSDYAYKARKDGNKVRVSGSSSITVRSEDSDKRRSQKRRKPGQYSRHWTKKIRRRPILIRFNHLQERMR